MRVPVTGAPDIKVTPRDGKGINFYQSDSRITMTNADVLGFVDAVVTIAQQNNAARTRNRQQDKT
jgi:hypothetical protein